MVKKTEMERALTVLTENITSLENSRTVLQQECTRLQGETQTLALHRDKTQAEFSSMIMDNEKRQSEANTLHHKSTEQGQQAAQKLVELQANAGRVSNKLAHQHLQLQTVTQQHKDATMQLERLLQQIKDGKVEVGAVTAELTRIHTLTQQQTAAAETQKLDFVRSYAEVMSKHQAQKQALDHSIMELKVNAEVLSVRRSELQQECARLQSDMCARSTALEGIKTETSSKQASLAGVTASVVRMKEEEMALEEQHQLDTNERQRAVSELDANKGELSGAVVQLRMERDAVEAERSEAKQRSEAESAELREALLTLQSSRQEAESSVELKQAELMSLRQQHEMGLGRFNQLRAEMDALKQEYELIVGKHTRVSVAYEHEKSALTEFAEERKALDDGAAANTAGFMIKKKEMEQTISELSEQSNTLVQRHAQLTVQGKAATY